MAPSSISCFNKVGLICFLGIVILIIIIPVFKNSSNNILSLRGRGEENTNVNSSVSIVDINNNNSTVINRKKKPIMVITPGSANSKDVSDEEEASEEDNDDYYSKIIDKTINLRSVDTMGIDQIKKELSNMDLTLDDKNIVSFYLYNKGYHETTTTKTNRKNDYHDKDHDENNHAQHIRSHNIPSS